MVFEIIIVILILAIWIYGDELSMNYGVYLASKEISRQYNAIDQLLNVLKQKDDLVASCKNGKTNCSQETQLTLVSAGIGDNQSDLSHIRNDISLVAKDLALINTTLPRTQGYDNAIKSINDRLVATNTRIKTSADMISKLAITY